MPGPQDRFTLLLCPLLSQIRHGAWWALSTLKDKTDRVLIPGFYDKGAPTDAGRNRHFENRPPTTPRRPKEYFGIDHFLNGKTRDEVLRGMYYEPTCNICGLVSGYIDPGQNGSACRPV